MTIRPSSWQCPRRAGCRRTRPPSLPGPASSSRTPAARATIAARSQACRTSRSLFLSASEIVNQLASGAAHLGITGEDLVREQIADADAAVALLTPLGFGGANVVVAVPQAWIDVRR